MDIGKFKASRTRLVLWILVPPLVFVGVGLSSHGLKLQSEWKLSRTKELSTVLPQLVNTQRQTEKIIDALGGKGSRTIQSEDELISFIQSVAGKVDFTVDSLKVDRRASAQNKSIPVLIASVKGSGPLQAIEDFVNEATSASHLLSESSLQVNKGDSRYGQDNCRADITFELVLFKHLNQAGGA
jgi:hypothetical protein